MHKMIPYLLFCTLQVPYSRAKAMADFALAHMHGLPVSIACLGLLYCKTDGLIGQTRDKEASLNLIDLSLLPLTPIMVSSCVNSIVYKLFHEKNFTVAVFTG